MTTVAERSTFDRQGDRADAERLSAAMRSFAEDYDSVTALRLEACIHCGMCAEACHFYVATEDPKYTPILKAEPLKQAYKREAAPLAPIFKLLGLKKAVSVEELEAWQHLAYDACTLCGRCSMICPMGIDVMALIEQTRRALFDAGLAPKELYEKAQRQLETGAPEASESPWAERLRSLAREHGLDVPLDRRSAEVLVFVPRTEIERYPETVVAMIEVLNHVGADYTFSSDVVVAENYGYYAGSREWQRDISLRIVEAARKVKASLVIVPECGHAYTALRWEAAELIGEALPFRVRHITEYLADQLAAGRLKLKSGNGATAVFHDPCQIARKGGAGDAPQALLKALGVPMKELTYTGPFSFCCGGGGGVFDIERARSLRYTSMKPKLDDIDGAGAEQLVTSCSDCRLNFADAGEHLNWNKTPHSLLEMVAAHLENGRSEA